MTGSVSDEIWEDDILVALCKTQVNSSLPFQFFCEEGWQDYHQREMDGYQNKNHFAQLTSKEI